MIVFYNQFGNWMVLVDYYLVVTIRKKIGMLMIGY